MIGELEKKIKYKFKDEDLLLIALTHSSYANEKSEEIEFNERLEFLGDSVLSLLISEYLFRNFPDYTEGDMTKIRALVVCENSLSLASKKIGIGKYLKLGKGEEKGGGRDRNSNLADVFEAVIGAIYIDGGLEKAYDFLKISLFDILKDTISGKVIFVDYKTKLQEILQKDNSRQMHYVLADEYGPEHDKRFLTELYIDGEVYGVGEGKTKKESEQNAAKIGYDKLCETL
ncbi:MAG: ribonuclease III [Andreesenia angusta]|nr:ribonuclease III [Andreesenia angusta]